MAEKYTTELAETVVALFAAGNLDPNATEIAEAHFPERALGREIENGIISRLVKVRNVIEEVYEIPCSLVAETYYVNRPRPEHHRRASYREIPPDTLAEASDCIPGGWDKKSHGIRRQNGDNDLIWRATVERVLISAAGKEKRGVDRVLAAVELSDLSSESALELLSAMRTRAEPERKELARQLYEEILAGEQKELEEGENHG